LLLPHELRLHRGGGSAALLARAPQHSASVEKANKARGGPASLSARRPVRIGEGNEAVSVEVACCVNDAHGPGTFELSKNADISVHVLLE
jgi:hypothetical protein